MYTVIITNNFGKYAVLVDATSEMGAIEIALADLTAGYGFTAIEAVFVKNYSEFTKEKND